MITFSDNSTIEMDYDPQGNKVWMEVRKIGEPIKTYSYLDNIVKAKASLLNIDSKGDIKVGDGSVKVGQIIGLNFYLIGKESSLTLNAGSITVKSGIKIKQLFQETWQNFMSFLDDIVKSELLSFPKNQIQNITDEE